MECGGRCELVDSDHQRLNCVSALFLFTRVLKGEILGQKKARQLRRETSSYGRTMNNEIAGLSSLQDTHANNKVIYSTRRKHFVLCVGTALRCKGGGGNSNE